MHFSAEVIFEKRLSPREGKNAMLSRVFEEFVPPPQNGGPPKAKILGCGLKKTQFFQIRAFLGKVVFSKFHVSKRSDFWGPRGRPAIAILIADFKNH